METNTKKTMLSIRQMAIIALMTALTCILAPMSVPIGAVPISLTNFVVYLAVYLLGAKLGTVSYCIYLLIGLCGLPVFSAYSGGPSKLLGPTGGYLIGFILMAALSGIFIEKSHAKAGLSILGMGIGTAAAYLFGTVWFLIQAKCSLWYALTVCVFPFLIGDGIKILIAAKIGPMIRRTLQTANLLEQS